MTGGALPSTEGALMVAIIDYGVGSSSPAFLLRRHRRGSQSERCAHGAGQPVVSQRRRLCGCLTSSASGMDGRAPRGESGKPVMGICLGMRLLFERSYEVRRAPGLGLLEGEVVGMEGRLPGA
ncbi:MAG: hypothetical protein ACLUEK_06430 [Oscillospiraceae bacterium]